ncbi:hypothetical protein A3850_011610 [Lewinella sp. 4G2]|nr:hypothetical protein A3850_011610 [Lewinella sp. 4G2]
MKGSSNYGDSVLEWNAALFQKPLTELNDGDLSLFTGKVLSTWGSITDLKHFIPRILELTAEYRTPYEIWILYDRLEMGKWTEWPADEFRAISNFNKCLVYEILTDGSEIAEENFMDYFTTLIYYSNDVEKLIEVVDNISCKYKYKHLSNFICNQSKLIFENNIIEGFYQFGKNVTKVKNWLSSKKFINEFTNGYFEHENEAFSEKVSWAEMILSQYKKY